MSKHGSKLKGKAATTFAARLGANMAFIQNSFQSLYGEDDQEAHLAHLVGAMIEAYVDRPKSLLALDKAREQNPDWLTSQEYVGMSAYVDRFAGDIKGMHAKLDYVEDLGVNWLHLLPIVDCPEGSNDGGYAVRNYTQVDSRFGTMDELRALTAEMRKRDMLLTLDLVLNHTSQEHEWAQKAKAGDTDFQDFYYIYPDRGIPDRLDKTMPEIFPESSPGNFTHVPELDAWAMTVFHDYQWDLNYRNPKVFIEMMRIVCFLANVGVDILRIDTPSFIWKRLGTACQNLWEAHLLIQLFKACVQVVAPAMAFIAEAIVAPKEIVRYFGEGKSAGREANLAYHAPLMALLWDALATQEVLLLSQGMKNLPTKPLGTTWITYARCHDDIGLVFDDKDIYAVGYDAPQHRQFLVDYYTGKYKDSHAKGTTFMHNPKTGDARISGSMAALTGLEAAETSGDAAEISLAIQRIQLLNALIMAYGGIPMLYYGDELGLPNDYSYVADPEKSYDNRWIHRPMWDDKRADQRKDPQSVAGRIFANTQNLIATRKATPEFADQHNRTWEDTHNKHVLSFLRWDDEGHRTLVVANFSQYEQRVDQQLLHRCGFDPLHIQDRITQMPLHTDSRHFTMEPYQCLYISVAS